MGASCAGAWAALLFAAVAFAGSNTPLPEGEGKKIVEGACASCHGLDVVGGKQWSRLRWEAVVAAMVDRGAPLKKGEAPVVVQYLAKNFGEDRDKALVEDICSLCHEWQRVKDHELTKEQWSGVIKGMLFEGAPVTDEEFNLIVEYLAKNFGPVKE
jgi:cytochrome c5